MILTEKVRYGRKDSNGEIKWDDEISKEILISLDSESKPSYFRIENFQFDANEDIDILDNGDIIFNIDVFYFKINKFKYKLEEKNVYFIKDESHNTEKENENFSFVEIANALKTMGVTEIVFKDGKSIKV